ncbi:Receptor-type tyrosine-protein phosphatase F [Geodia barretti]|uniref:Receptor-type tyrosine-protein phosphatase F n=1 Tax=Geodia barretti TaxID=519541 RepID=A0AA35QSD0_GEOBA|nr:Receptor-type tyrosine-protein phosphatase F [Geodia barretti]
MEGIPLPEPLVGEQRDTSATVTGLHPGINYTCVAVTFTPWQISPPQNITYSTSEIVPTGSPEAFEAVVGQRQVVFTWSPPPVTQRNGVITSYTLSCSPSPSSLPQSPSSQSGSLTATGFSPNTLHSCSLTATNSQGSGPPSIRIFITLEDFVFN